MYINPESAVAQVGGSSTSPTQRLNCLRPWRLFLLSAIIEEVHPAEPLLVWVIDYKEPPGFV